MRTRTFGRLGAATVVALGLVIATALPASATVHEFDITASSTMTIGTTTAHITGGHSTTNICAANSQTDTLSVDLDSSGGGTVSGAGRWADVHVGTSTNYEARLIITAGTIAITATTVTVNLTIVAEFASCGSTPIVCRTNPVTLISTGPNPTGSLHPGASTATTLSGTSNTITTFVGCNAIIRAAINGFPASVSFNVHLAT